METLTDFIFLGSKITADGDCSHEIKRRLLLGKKAMINIDNIFKSRDSTLPTKVCLVKVWFFQWSCVDVRVECGCESFYKKGWAPKSWSFWPVVLKTLESPLDCKEIQSVHPKGNQSWIFIGKTDDEAEAEAPILWPPHAKNWLIWKVPDAGNVWRWEEKGMTEMRWLDGITDLMNMSLSELRSWWWTGRPGVLQSMGSQRVGHDWATELNWSENDACFIEQVFKSVSSQKHRKKKYLKVQ